MTRKDIPSSYWQASSLLGKRESRTICCNTSLERLNEDTIALRYHSTNVVTFHLDGRIVLRSGGWETVTTKDRMNRCLRNSGYSVFQKKFQWFVWDRESGSEQVYFDGYTISTNQSNVA
jgi:hypothetical protein